MMVSLVVLLGSEGVFYFGLWVFGYRGERPDCSSLRRSVHRFFHD